MTKKYAWKTGAAILCVCTLTAGLLGCGTEEKSEEEKILRVVTDGRLYNDVEFAARFLEGVDSGIEVRIQRLPDKQEERKTEIQKLRTEIMAGKGPDVYLLDGGRETGKEFLPLLENPYQTMQSGALAPLDDLMEKDSYWEDSTYSKAILKEGQYDGRQYILPMSVNYYVLPRADDMEKMTGNTLGEWVEQAESSQDVRIKEAFYSAVWSQCARWIQPAADYETGEVLFNKEKWYEFADRYFQLRAVVREGLTIKGESYRFESVVVGDRKSEMDLQFVPDIEGKKMASIQTYGAVGMSSDLKQEAYDFLMLFLNDRSQNYNKEHSETPLPFIFGYLDHGTYAPVQESAFDFWMGYPPEEVLQETISTFREIEGAYFLTKAEREVFEGIDEIAIRSSYPDYNWNSDLSKLADSAWNTYKMMVSE